MKIGVKLGPL